MTVLPEELVALRLRDVKAEIDRLVGGAKLPAPSVVSAFDCDPVDVVLFKTIRVKFNPDLAPEAHARHLFGHWLCVAHQGYWLEHLDARCDQIAEFIAQLVGR